MVPELYVVPLVIPVPVSTATVVDVMVFTTYTWFMAVCAAVPVCPDTVTVSPTTNGLVPAACVNVVSVAEAAAFEVTDTVNKAAVVAPLLYFVLQSVSSTNVVIGSFPLGQRLDMQSGPKNSDSCRSPERNPTFQL